ncbi:Uncharacterised protein [Streptococcus porcinus]|nr:Uncharacterised protein [Streptococcus porcinus]
MMLKPSYTSFTVSVFLADSNVTILLSTKVIKEYT